VLTQQRPWLAVSARSKHMKVDHPVIRAMTGGTNFVKASPASFVL
jgi:hypothetical protein